MDFLPEGRIYPTETNRSLISSQAGLEQAMNEDRILEAKACLCNGSHDLIVHNYGPGRVMVSLHAEVPGDGNLFKLHDLIDNIERELGEKLGCIATIHLDPIDTHNPELASLREQAEQAARALDPRCSVHDVRLVPGDTHLNLIFDVLVPFDLKMEDAEVRKAICEKIPRLSQQPKMYAVIAVDRDYTGRR